MDERDRGTQDGDYAAGQPGGGGQAGGGYAPGGQRDRAAGQAGAGRMVPGRSNRPPAGRSAPMTCGPIFIPHRRRDDTRFALNVEKARRREPELPVEKRLLADLQALLPKEAIALAAPGVPGIVICHRGRALGLHLMARGDRLSYAQTNQFVALRDAGMRIEVARDARPGDGDGAGDGRAAEGRGAAYACATCSGRRRASANEESSAQDGRGGRAAGGDPGRPCAGPRAVGAGRRQGGMVAADRL